MHHSKALYSEKLVYTSTGCRHHLGTNTWHLTVMMLCFDVMSWRYGMMLRYGVMLHVMIFCFDVILCYVML